MHDKRPSPQGTPPDATGQEITRAGWPSRLRAEQHASDGASSASASDATEAQRATREASVEVERLANALATERAAREAAEARAHQLEALFEAMTDGVVLYDRDGRVLRINAATRELYGVDADSAALGQPIWERMPIFLPSDEYGEPMPREEWPQTRLLRGEELRGDSAVDMRVRSLDGRVRQINISGAPIYDVRGDLDGAICVFRDVTERRRLERRTTETLGALLAMAETLVMPWDLIAPRGQLEPGERAEVATRATAARLATLACSVLGCRRSAMLTVDPASAVLRPLAVSGLSAEEEARWTASWEGARHMSDRLDTGVLARLGAGEVVMLDVTQPAFREQFAPFGVNRLVVAPMRIGERLIGLFGVDYGPVTGQQATDSTAVADADRTALTVAIATLGALVVERNKLLHERSEARANELALRSANRQMDEFLSIASHELKTPLTSIKAYLQVVARRLRQPTPAAEDAATVIQSLQAKVDGALEILGRMHEQTDQLIRLVGDLLDTSRIQVKKLRIEMAPCDVNGVVHATVEAQRVANPARSIRLHAPAGSVMIVADADRIAQVMTNYLTNAIKYAPAEEPIDVVVEMTEGQARVAVADRGPGLPPEEQEQIWERFHRVAGIRDQTGSGAGLGLGLYISRTLIEQQGGEVGVESAPGEGSTFFFTLPLAPQTER
jgi:PAS domain S-box-containing protein